MNRILTFFLVIFMVLGILIVPVSASGFDAPFDFYTYDLLEYGFLFGQSNQTTFGEEIVIPIKPPEVRAISSFDILFSLGGSTVPSVSVSHNGSTYTQLSVISYGVNLYRAFADVSFRTYDTIYLKISVPGSSSLRLTINSIRISNNTNNGTLLNGSIEANTFNGTKVDSFSAGDWGYVAINSTETNLDDIRDTYSVDYTVPDAYKYDYVYIECGSSTADSVSEITAQLGTDILPYTVSYLSPASSNTGQYFVICVDLTGVPRTNTDPLYIQTHGSFNRTTDFYAYVFKCYGFVDIPEPSKFSYLMSRLSDWFGSLLDLLGADNDPDGFKEDVQEKTDELNDLSQSIGNVPEPDISNVNLDISGQISPQILAKANQGIGTLLSNQFILRLFILAITFALAGFILYGKK